MNPLSGMPDLQSIGLLKGLSENPEQVPKTDIAGLVVGGLVGWYIATKFPKHVIKLVGVAFGAELGILIARMVNNK